MFHYQEKANSSEDLLVRESAVVLMETAKEKLKGAAQAGLVAGGAAGAVRAAVVRAAATLHEADNRMRRRKEVRRADTRAHSYTCTHVYGQLGARCAGNKRTHEHVT